MKKQQFLDYVSHLINEKTNIYYNDQEQYFYFYNNKFIFKIKSDSASSALVIEQEVNHVKFTEAVYLEKQECIDLMKLIIPIYQESKYQSSYKYEDFNEVLFFEKITKFKKFLKIYNPQNTIDKEDLTNYSFTFPLDGINNICRLGRITNTNEPKIYLLTSVVQIPIYLPYSNEKKVPIIGYELTIPAWEIKDYPVLKHFAEPKLIETDFDAIFENLIVKLPNGKELLKDCLNISLPLNHKKSSITKI